MNRIEVLYNKLVEMIYEMEEESEERRIELVNYICFLMCFNPKLLKSPEVYERLDVLVSSNNTIIMALEAIMLVGDDAYNSNNLLDLSECYVDVLKIENLFCDYDSYFNLLKCYQLCIDEHNINTLTAKLLCHDYEDYIKLISNHFSLVLEEKYNTSISLVEGMNLVKKDNRLVIKYLKKKEK